MVKALSEQILVVKLKQKLKDILCYQKSAAFRDDGYLI